MRNIIILPYFAIAICKNPGYAQSRWKIFKHIHSDIYMTSQALSELFKASKILVDSPTTSKQQIAKLAKSVADHVEDETMAHILSDEIMMVLQELLTTTYRLGYQEAVANYLGKSHNLTHFQNAVNKYKDSWMETLNRERVEHLTKTVMVEHFQLSA
jgi:hypothetical protein